LGLLECEQEKERALIDRFRRAGIGPAAMLSRATAGPRAQALVFSMPGDNRSTRSPARFSRGTSVTPSALPAAAVSRREVAQSSPDPAEPALQVTIPVDVPVDTR